MNGKRRSHEIVLSVLNHMLSMTPERGGDFIVFVQTKTTQFCVIVVDCGRRCVYLLTLFPKSSYDESNKIGIYGSLTSKDNKTSIVKINGRSVCTL